MDVLAIAETWSFWDQAPAVGIPRDVELPKELSDRIALVVQGVRRCGKSTLLQQLLGRYALHREHCAFLNFEDPRLSNALTHETLEALVRQFRARHGPEPRLTFFLDEIQWVDGWQKWLRAKLERPRNNAFVITGSNAQLLSGELGTSLTGRHLSIELFPFTWAEAQRSKRRTSLSSYLTTGGFPEAMRSADGDSLLRQYFHDIVERDVRERVAARSSQALRQLVQMVFESAGSELSLRRVAAATGIAVETAQSYLDACEAAYLLFSCPFFAFSERKRSSRNKKYYPVDTGLRRVSTTTTGSDRGKLLECAAFIALRRQLGRACYWRDKGEVDFVVEDRSGAIIPLQVSWEAPTDRHRRGLDAFYERFPHAGEPVFVTPAAFGALESGALFSV